MDAPNRDMPYTDKAAPTRTKLRKDSDDPKDKKSSTESEAPSRAIPKRENDEPNRKKLRKANDDPI
jgi:hypothetical protein